MLLSFYERCDLFTVRTLRDQLILNLATDPSGISFSSHRSTSPYEVVQLLILNFNLIQFVCADLSLINRSDGVSYL